MTATPHHHPTEESKPVSFTVPLILALVTLLALFLFLRLCDPKPHGHGDEHGASVSTHDDKAGHQPAAGATTSQGGASGEHGTTSSPEHH